MRSFLACLAMTALASAHAAAAGAPAARGDSRSSEATRWRSEAAAVSIVRDEWGIAHVYGRSDADAVFGALYAQAEDDFHRIEHNYMAALGRLAEADGDPAIYRDLRQRLFIDPDELRRVYGQSPGWLKSLMRAWADGLNFYLSVHREVKPEVIAHFEPWMALSFTEGSIGGDIETIDLRRLAQFYPAENAPTAAAATLGSVEARREEVSLGGSNGFAIAPQLSASGHALLWINPHTSFYFRAELQMVSEEGLDAYGAATWGQFFIYQGFNAHNGWMHTSYGGDAVDEYAETLVDSGGTRSYRYAGRLRPVQAVPVSHASWTDCPRGRGPMDRREDSPRPGARAGAVLLAQQDHRLRLVPQDAGHAHRYDEQHGVCGCRRQHRLLSRQLHSEARPAFRLHAPRGWQQSRH
jgi:acyl-homoserine-lactone acylase